MRDRQKKGIVKIQKWNNGTEQNNTYASRGNGEVSWNYKVYVIAHKDESSKKFEIKSY